jgi:hypothetical protein
MAKRTRVTFFTNDEKPTFFKSKKCYICKKRRGTIEINRYGETICKECNELFDVWFILEKIKEKSIPQKLRNTFLVSSGNLEVLKRIPYLMAEEKWRNKLRELVFDYISEVEVLGIR